MNHLPFGLVETKGTTPKYPEVSIFSSMMSCKMLFVQSSPSQLRHVALLSSAEIEFFNCVFFCEMVSQQSHSDCITHQCCHLFVNTAKHTQTSHRTISLPAMLPMLVPDLIRLEFGRVFPSSTQLL